MESITKGRIILTALSIAIAITAAQVEAAIDVDSLYHRAMDAYEAEDYVLSDSLATLALAEIDSIEAEDWTYSGERQPRDAVFFGDYIMIRAIDKNTGRRLIEIYDPKKDELLRVHDMYPWTMGQHLRKTENFIFIILEKDGFLGYKIMCFRKGEVEPERFILRKGIEEHSITWAKEGDIIGIIEKGAEGLVLTIMDFATGEINEIHTMQKAGENVNIWDYPYQLMKDSTDWKLIDGNSLYSIDPSAGEIEFIRELPFEIRWYDSFYKGNLRVVRNDTLFINEKGDPTYNIRLIKLPFSIVYTEWAGIPRVNKTGNLIAHNDGDSLRIMDIIGNMAKIVFTTSSVGDERLWWQGDTLIHFGDKGLKIFKDLEVIYSIEGENVRARLDNMSNTVYIHQMPDRLSAIDLASGKTLWKRKLNLPEDRRMNFLKENCLNISHGKGVIIIDSRSGDEIINEQTESYVNATLNEDSTKILLEGRDVAKVYGISGGRTLKSDFTSLSAACKWAENDTAAAVQLARKTLSISGGLSSKARLFIYDIFDAMNLKREIVRLIGRSALETDEPLWRDKLFHAGTEIFSEPCIPPFFSLYITDAGAFSFAGSLRSGNWFKGQNMECYWFAPPFNEGEKQLKSFAGASLTGDGIIFYEFVRDSLNEKLSWTPMLLTESGEWKNLGFLLKTSFSEKIQPKLGWSGGFSIDYPVSSNLPDRMITNFSRIDEEFDFSPFTVGIDLTGEGINWYDTTTVEAVRVGNRYYTHKKWGTVINLVTEGTQADSLGIQVGDIVISFGGYSLCNTIDVDYIKKQYPLRTPLNFTVLRDDDTLHFTVLNGRIGYQSANCYNLVEIDPETGEHLSEIKLQPGYWIEAVNSSGELVYKYQRQDTILFFDPIINKEKKIIIKDLKDYGHLKTLRKNNDIVLYTNYSDKLLALDVSKTADDSARVLWKQSFENISGYAKTDDGKTLPLLLKDGTLLIIERATGDVLARETLPFKNIDSPQIKDGVLYGIVSGRLFGWKIAYYHPPFPWKYVGYGAAALVPLLIATWPIYRIRIDKLKRRQVIELERAEMEAELTAARTLQASLIPAGSHKLGQFNLVGKFIPASAVGGDYFDFRLLDDGRLIVVMGDVSGHGLPAGTLVAMAKASLITVHRSKNVDFQDTLDAINEVIRRSSSGKMMFMTFCYLVIEPEKGIIGCSANGHPFPLIAHKDGTVSEIATIGGYPLGVRDQQDFRIIEADFQRGDTLLMFTDGLPEQVNSEGEPWGYDRFQQAFGELSRSRETEGVVDGLLESGLKYSGDAVQGDDMTVIVIRYDIE